MYDPTIFQKARLILQDEFDRPHHDRPEKAITAAIEMCADFVQESSREEGGSPLLESLARRIRQEAMWRKAPEREGEGK